MGTQGPFCGQQGACRPPKWRPAASSRRNEKTQEDLVGHRPQRVFGHAEDALRHEAVVGAAEDEAFVEGVGEHLVDDTGLHLRRDLVQHHSVVVEVIRRRVPGGPGGFAFRVYALGLSFVDRGVS